jgi:nitroreductase
MELTEIIRHRRMTRDYDPDRALPPGLTGRLVDAGLRAPSAGFTQGVSFLILESETSRNTFWAATAESGGEPDSWLTGMRRAPALIMVLTSKDAYLDRYALADKGWTDRSQSRWPVPFWHVDAGMAAMAILYAITDAGLGGCFFGVPAEQTAAVREAFVIPSDQQIAGVISIGYPAADQRPSGSPRSRARRPRTELVHREHW